jgi:hypothetical protein
MAKKHHQRIDDLIAALVWMRRHESSPISAAKNNTQVDMDAIARLAVLVVTVTAVLTLIMFGGFAR